MVIFVLIFAGEATKRKVSEILQIKTIWYSLSLFTLSELCTVLLTDLVDYFSFTGMTAMFLQRFGVPLFFLLTSCITMQSPHLSC